MQMARQLYMLPFDPRDSFEHRLFGFKGVLDSDETAQIIDARRLIYEVCVRALERDVHIVCANCMRMSDEPDGGEAGNG